VYVYTVQLAKCSASNKYKYSILIQMEKEVMSSVDPDITAAFVARYVVVLLNRRCHKMVVKMRPWRSRLVVKSSISDPADLL
jgi:hypothetical protein